MNIIRVNLSTRLGQATTGDVQALADDPLVNSVVLVQVTPTGAQRRAFPVHHDPRRNSYDRGAAEEVFTGTFDDALAELREQIVNVDLIEPDERRIAIGVESVSDAPAHLDDLLGPLHHSIICNNLMPTRAELLTRLGGYLGVAFHLYDGPGLPNMERQVLSDFVILDRTVGDILDDLVLMTNPRTWMTAGVVHVDGRELGQAQLPAIPTASNINRVFVAGGEYFPPDAGEPDPGEDPEENFETSDDATHEWVEYTHAGEDSQETHYRLVKQDGNLVLEEEMRYGYVQTTSGPRWVMTYHVRKEHDFLPYCRGALVRSVETVRQTRTDMVFWTSRVNTITGITHVRDWAPDLILSSRKLVTQRWHAEGWLRSRTETTDEAAGLVQSATGADTGSVAYKRTTRTEEWTPTGGGQWLQRVTEHIPTSRPVYEIETDGGYQVLTTYPIAKINTYSRPTDSPPPQLSCSGIDPAAQCENREEEEFHEARAINDPDRYVVTVTVPGLALAYTVGEILWPSAAYVAGVRFSYTPESAETEIELWLPT